MFAEFGIKRTAAPTAGLPATEPSPRARADRVTALPAAQPRRPVRAPATMRRPQTDEERSKGVQSETSPTRSRRLPWPRVERQPQAVAPAARPSAQPTRPSAKKAGLRAAPSMGRSSAQPARWPRRVRRQSGGRRERRAGAGAIPALSTSRQAGLDSKGPLRARRGDLGDTASELGAAGPGGAPRSVQRTWAHAAFATSRGCAAIRVWPDG